MYKEILETTIQAFKSRQYSELVHSPDELRVIYNKDDNSYTGEFDTKDFDISIVVESKYNKTWLGRKLLCLKLNISFTKKGYVSIKKSKNYKFPFDSDKEYDKYKLDIFNLLKAKFELDILTEEQRKDLDILTSLNTIIDDKYKREDKIDNLLEND